jgi:hypothetical protein
MIELSCILDVGSFTLVALPNLPELMIMTKYELLLKHM